MTRRHVDSVRQHHRLMAAAFASGLRPDSPEFFRKVQVNPCGSCSLCCELPMISTEQYAEGTLPTPPKFKAFGKKCELLGCSGCTQYEARPDTCRGYLCFHALGINPVNPKEGGVAWSLEPEKEHMRSWVAVGHCYDADVMVNLPQVMADALLYQHTMFTGMAVDYIVLRSPGKGIRLRFRASLQADEMDIGYSAQRALLKDDSPQEVILDVEDISLDHSVLDQAIELLRA